MRLMDRPKTVRPDMGEYYYTRYGHAAYVAYSLEAGSPLPVKGNPYPVAIGFVFANHNPTRWDTSGRNLSTGSWDFVERITMETAFAYPKRQDRPKPPEPSQLGMLL